MKTLSGILRMISIRFKGQEQEEEQLNIAGNNQPNTSSNTAYVSEEPGRHMVFNESAAAACKLCCSAVHF